MSQELSQKQLERMVVGKPQTPTTVFYDQSKMNPDMSKAAGRRVYTTVLMVKYTQPGVTDWAPARAQKEDIAAHPEEYQYYLNTKDDVGSPGIDIIPGANPDEIQELIDYGLTSITKLCEAITLPEHLLHVQASARRISEAFENERHTNEETHDEESTTQSGHQEGRGADEGQVLPTQGGRDNQRDVGRHTAPRSPRVGDRETEEGIRPGRRINSNQTSEVQSQKVVGGQMRPAYPSVNWSMKFG